MSSDNVWIVRVRGKAEKALARIPEKDKARILGVLDSLRENPFAGDVEKMKGEERVWRRRVGAYRIFYELTSDDKAVYVFRVERRTSKTY